MPNYMGFGSLPLLSQRTGVSHTSKALFAGACCAPARKVWQCSDSRKPLAVQTEPFTKSKATPRSIIHRQQLQYSRFPGCFQILLPLKQKILCKKSYFSYRFLCLLFSSSFFFILCFRVFLFQSVLFLKGNKSPGCLLRHDSSFIFTYALLIPHAGAAIPVSMAVHLHKSPGMDSRGSTAEPGSASPGYSISSWSYSLAIS